jgi:hypothetical protein
MISQVNPYPSGETIETAFWKTLVCDNGTDGDAITEEYLTHFKAFKRFKGFLSKSESTTNGLDDKNSAIQYIVLFNKVSDDRAFCITKNGFMG